MRPFFGGPAMQPVPVHKHSQKRPHRRPPPPNGDQQAAWALGILALVAALWVAMAEA